MLSRVLAWSVVVSIALIAPLKARAEQTVLVFSFENQTDDRNIDWIGEGLADLVSDRLFSESELYVFNRDEREAAYDRLGIPKTVSVSRATTMKIAWDLGADAAIVGSISGTHDNFRIRARIVDLATTSSTPDVEVAGKLQDVIPLAAKLASQLVKSLVPSSTAPEADYTLRPPVPRSAFEAYVRGLIANDPQRRIQLLQDAVRLHPQYFTAMYQLGRAHQFDMNLGAAGPMLEKVPLRSPEYLPARFALGLIYYNQGDYVKAASVFAVLPPTYDDLINLGAALAAKGDFAAAQTAWKQASDRDPFGAEAPFNLAWLAFTRGEFETAAKGLDQFFRLQGRDAEALFLLGRVNERLGRLDESQRMIAQAIRLSPRLERWMSQPIPNFQRLRTQPDSTELRTAFGPPIWNATRLSRRSLGQDLEAWLASVENEMESQLYGEALRELQDIRRTFPHSHDAPLLLAQIYERQKQYDVAVREYRNSIQLKPTAEAYILLAKLRRTMSQIASAVQAVQQALILEPGNYEALSLKAELDRIRR